MAVDKNKISAEATRLVQKGQYDKAIKAYQKIIAGDPGDLRVLLKIGELHQKKGDSAAAAETFGRVAEAYASQGFFLKSVAVYKQVAKLAPDDAGVNERLAALYQQLGLLSESMAQLQLIAAAAERTGDDKKLFESLRRIVELDPDNVGAAVSLGDVYARQSQTKLALEQFRRAAEALKRNSRTDEYLKVADRIAALAPDDLPLARELASMLLARGDTKRALSKLQRCFKTDPKNLQTLELLAKAFEDLGQTSKMVAVFREMARLHAGGGRLPAAHAAWRKVLDLVPDDTEALAALAPPGTRPPPVEAPAEGSNAAAILLDATPSTSLAAIPEPTPPPAAAAITTAAPVAPAPAVSPSPAAGASEPAAPGRPSPSPPESGPEAIAKLLGETDVYVKYALHEKALDHLQKIFSVDPDHLDARERASRIRELRKDAAGAAEEALRAARIALARGLDDRARNALDRVRALAPGHAALAQIEGALPPAMADAAADEGVILEIEELEAPEEDHDDLALTAAGAPADEVVDEHPAGDSTGPEPAEGQGEPLSVRPEPVEGRPQAPSAQDDDRFRQDLAEADFFIGQRLLDEARELLDELRASYPGHPEVESRLQRIALQHHDPPVAAGAERHDPIDDVTRPFDQQVEATVTVEDSATHYDLGIAYKEMGLLDAALQEFELALNGASNARQADCLAMIGLCRVEKGDPAAAVEAYRRALRRPGLTPVAVRELRYQLAAAHEAAGEVEAALWYLNRVVESEPGYRDAGPALMRLGGGGGRRPDGDPAEDDAAPGASASGDGDRIERDLASGAPDTRVGPA